MGGGSWTTEVYREHEDLRARTGRSAFDYSDHTKRVPKDEWKAHPTLDPLGVRVRESRDSLDHPESLAIAVHFDVTGSMSTLPTIFQKKLGELNGLLQRKGYVEHPQIMFGAIGDAYTDQVPLQVGQFESDNRMDEDLGKIFLEANGGGQKKESYDLALYFMARHTEIDCWEKRGQKGYLFIVGDELAYPKVIRSQVRKVIGDILREDISLEKIVEEVKSRYELFFVIPSSISSYAGDIEVLSFWKRLLGENVLKLDDPEAICEVIAVQIGLCEGTTDLDASDRHLKELGVSTSTRLAVRKAVNANPNTRSLVVKGSDRLPGLRDSTDEPRTKRL